MEKSSEAGLLKFEKSLRHRPWHRQRKKGLHVGFPAGPLTQRVKFDGVENRGGVEQNQKHKAFFGGFGWMPADLAAWIQRRGQRGIVDVVLPDFPVRDRHHEVQFGPARPRIEGKRAGGDCEARHDSQSLRQGKPMLSQPSSDPHEAEAIACREERVGGYREEGMSALASTKSRRGMRIIRSSGAQPASAGSSAWALAVISCPMMAKSPSSSSKRSGHPPLPAHKRVSGPGPSRLNVMALK